MIQEIVYSQSRYSDERRFLMDMTLLAYQSNGHTCAVLSEVHTELHAVTHRRGVDTSRVLFSEPSSTEQAREIMESLVRSGVVGLVIVEGFEHLTSPSFVEKITDLAIKTQTSILYAR